MNKNETHIIPFERIDFAVKPGIIKDDPILSLRHRYARHLLEQGIDIRYIQKLPGYSSPNTTMIYTHVSTGKIKNIKSPLDI